MFRKFLFCILTLSIFSCNQTNTKMFDYGDSSFSALVYTQYKNEINFSIAKIPNDYFLQQSSLEDIDSLEFEDVFIYELIAEDTSDLMKTKSNLEYDKVVRHMSQQIFEDFEAVNTKGQRIPCQGVSHERTFNIRPQERLILYFKRNNNYPIEKIIYTDRLYGAGQVVHTLKEQNIKL